jgi:Iodothyronine deiodinase
MPLLVDSIDDQVNRAYSGFPDRLYLLDREGKVAYKGGRGPFGYKPRELEQSLLMMLIEEELAKVPAAEPTKAPE